MAERSDRRQLAAAVVVACALLVGRSLLLPATSVAAPAAQEQPGKDLDLELGTDITETLEAWDSSEIWQRFVFRLSLPAGAELTVWLGEDAQGGCYTDARLYESGNQVGYTRVGPQPSSWSEPIVATIASGKAQLSVGAYDDCDASVVFPTEKHFRFQVGWGYETIQLPPRILYLRANGQEGSTTANAGARVTLSWEWEGVEAGYLNPGNIGMACPAMPCTYDVTPAASTTYTLRATNSAGSVERSVTVNVRAPPVIEFWAEQDQILVDACTTLHWHIENIQAAYLSGGGFDSLGVGGPRGSQRVCPAVDTTYDLRVVIYQAAEQLIDETRQVTIRVEQPPTPTPTRPPTRTPTRTPTRIPTRTPTRAPSRTPTRIPTRTPTRTPTLPPPDASGEIIVPEVIPPDASGEIIVPAEVPPDASGEIIVPAEGPLSMTPQLLVVTHSNGLSYFVPQDGGSGDTWWLVESWIEARYGSDGYHLLDLAEDSPTEIPDRGLVDGAIETQWGQGRYWAIFIVGGPHIVPWAEMVNPTGDGDILWTDDPYADLNGDLIPDTPLARLPDGGDLGLLRTQLTSAGSWGEGGLVMALPGRTYAEQFAAAAGTDVVYSPPYERSQGVADSSGSGFAYFDLAGSLLNSTWHGWDSAAGGFPLAFTPEDARCSGVVVTMVSYGALVPACGAPGCAQAVDTVPLGFLRSGSMAFMGTTGQNYALTTPKTVEVCTEQSFGLSESCYTMEVEGEHSQVAPGIPAFTESHINHWADTLDPLVAYYLAKVDTLRHAYGYFANPDGSIEAKMGHGLVYYGVPSAAADCRVCVPQVYKPIVPAGRGPEGLQIDVERPLLALDSGTNLNEGCGFLDCECSTADSDKDGLSDALEWRLAYEFEPYLEFDEWESAVPWDPYSFDIYHQVSPIQEEGKPPQIMLTWVLAYDRDYGSVDPHSRLWERLVRENWSELFEAHNGDTEYMRVRLGYEFAYPLLTVWMEEYIITRHHDPPKPYTLEQGNYPHIYVSRDKHAMFPTLEECREYLMTEFGLDKVHGVLGADLRFEECGGGPRGWASQISGYLRSNHNAGEVELQDHQQAGEGYVYRGTEHWREHTETFNRFDLWTTEERFCGNTPDCTRYWEPVQAGFDLQETAVHLPEKIPIIKDLYGWCKDLWIGPCKATEASQELADLYLGALEEGVAGRFFDKGSGPFGPRWWRSPVPADLLSRQICIQF